MPSPKGGAQILDDFLDRRDFILQELFHQGVVEIGQGLEHETACLVLSFAHAVWHLDHVGRCARFVFIGLLGDEIDITHDVFAVADGNLGDQKRGFGHILHGGKQITHQRGRAVHLVDEDHGRNAVLFKELEDRPQGGGPFNDGFVNDDGGVDSHQGVACFGEKLDGAGTIDDVERYAFERGVGSADLGRHLALACLGR